MAGRSKQSGGGESYEGQQERVLNQVLALFIAKQVANQPHANVPFT